MSVSLSPSFAISVDEIRTAEKKQITRYFNVNKAVRSVESTRWSRGSIRPRVCIISMVADDSVQLQGSIFPVFDVPRNVTVPEIRFSQSSLFSVFDVPGSQSFPAVQYTSGNDRQLRTSRTSNPGNIKPRDNIES